VTEAVAEYREALRLNPGLTSAHAHLATALLRLGQADEARNEFEIVLSGDPSYRFAAQIALGLLLANSGDLTEGLNHVQEAVRLHPDDQGGQILLGQMLMNTPGHLSDALLHFREALLIDARNAGAQRSLGSALLRMPGGRDEAIAHLEIAQRIEPDPKLAAQIDQLKADRGKGR
jgi:tetratricopeptide (TPR) repeat protein